jgi:predicted nucleotidyltransferase
MSNSKVFPPDFKEFVELLNENGVKYLITGGYAVAYYGHPRYTGDIDFWIEASPENAEKLIQVLKDFGMDSLNLTAEDFIKPDSIIQISCPPHRINIMNEIDGVHFAEAYSTKLEVEIDGVNVNLISLQDLKENKRASGRHRDLDDLENL